MTENKSLKQTILERCADLNVSDLVIDKDSSYKGRKSTMVSFVMNNPQGFDTGKLFFEIWLANDLVLDTEKKADLVYSYASTEAKIFDGMDAEVET